MSNVKVVLTATEGKFFPPGTQFKGYKAKLNGGAALDLVAGEGLGTVTFPDVPAGLATAEVFAVDVNEVQIGASATNSIEVPAPVSVAVPATLTVSLA